MIATMRTVAKGDDLRATAEAEGLRPRSGAVHSVKSSMSSEELDTAMRDTLDWHE